MKLFYLLKKLLLPLKFAFRIIFEIKTFYLLKIFILERYLSLLVNDSKARKLKFFILLKDLFFVVIKCAIFIALFYLSLWISYQGVKAGDAFYEIIFNFKLN